MYSKIKSDISKLSNAIFALDSRCSAEDREATTKEKAWRAEAQAELDHLKKSLPVGAPLTLQNGPLGGLGDGRTIDAEVVKAGTGRTFRAMFGHRPGERLDSGDFKNAAEFFQVMDSGRYDPRLQVRASMGEGVPSSGGFSVPSQFAADWLDASLPNEIVRNLCKVYPMESQSLEVAGWDGSDMSAGKTHGGLEMVFLAEGSTATPQTAKLRKINLVAKMGAIYIDGSIELFQDGKGFAENLETALRTSMGYGIDRYLLTGSGAGCPQGVLSAPCKIQVAGETGQHADSIVYQNLKKMFSRALNPDKSVWLFNATAIPDLLEQSVSVGLSGNHVPLLNESNGKFTIFGRPVYFSPIMPAIGDADDCAFVDFGFYSMGLRKEVWIDQTDAVRWLQRERSMRILLRFDGQCTLNAAVTPENGLSLSPVVTMAARA